MTIIDDDDIYDSMLIDILKSPKTLNPSEGSVVRDIVLNTPAYYSKRQKNEIEKIYERVCG